MLIPGVPGTLGTEVLSVPGTPDRLSYEPRSDYSVYEISHHKQVDDRLVSWVMISGVKLPSCLYLFTSS